MKKIFNGIHITYRYHIGSNEKNVLLLHGWGGSLNSFKQLEDSLIAQNFSVLTMDFPGFGGSDLPHEDWDLDDYVKVAYELINHEKISKISLVCHSFGGRVGIMLASQFPNLIEKLILVDSAGIKPRFSLKKSIKVTHYKFLKQLKKIGLIKKDLSNYGSEDYRAMPNELKAVFNKIVCKDLSKQSKQIICSTLIIWGRDDEDTPYYMAKKLNRNIKDSAIITFKGGHFAYLSEANKFVIIVSQFLLN